MSHTVKFFRCTCGKLHTATCITPLSRCTCGENLWLLVGWVNNAPNVKR